MKYNVGDKVRIKSLDWYKENKNELGQIDTDYTIFIPRMAEYCGKEATIFSVEIDNYVLEGIPYTWTDEMIEGLVEEETKSEDGLLDEYEELTGRAFKGGYEKCKSDIELNGFQLPEGYQFVDENGNVINATKIVLEKKEKEYPKTYEECAKVLGYNQVMPKDHILGYKGTLLSAFQQLLICRDAYWKIAGEEMGLSGSWKPDFASCKIKYAITYYNNVVSRYSEVDYNSTILVFPTEEMRDTFYENFDPDIEICKELL